MIKQSVPHEFVKKKNNREIQHVCTNTCSKPCSKQEQDKQMMIVISDALIDPRTMVIKSSNTNIAKSFFVKKKSFYFFFFFFSFGLLAMF